ncbi:S-layer homology domain-containing protein [Paenibacillus lignilyticus]|uniref:S-layer homology domain-containing protein n=1 Tax=Paenibacillus lignilyticus TaxID=1172615 RepID=A0ABS5CHK5_9BACL|nr:S-layer homology domain-containing protein [Paenibacillus lignilyticus]MBP3965303.1 S-layer homology domain-containing protein [Paenibacillus lignilyticus]
MRGLSKLLLLIVIIALLIPAYSASAAESQLRDVHIYRTLWKGDPRIIKPIQDMSFDFIVSTREHINGSDMVFIDKAGTDFILRAEGYPDVPAKLVGGFGDPADTGFEFLVDEHSPIPDGVPYQLIAPSISTEYVWHVEPGVVVVKGASSTPSNPTPTTPGNSLDYGNDIDPNYDQPISSTFKDVANNYWALTAIEDLAKRGVLGGYPDGKFRPEKIVTRAEFAKIMMLASGVKAKKVTKSTFADLQPSDWETPFVEASKQYLNGYKLSSGKVVFKPNSPALREDITTALVKLKGYDKTHMPDQSIIQAMFKDFNGISKFARDAVAIAIETGIASGFPDETFRPQQPVTRAQAAAMLWRAYQFGNDNKSDDTEDKVELDDNDNADNTEPVQLPDDGSGYSVSVQVVDVNGEAVNTGVYLRGEDRDYPVTNADREAGIYTFNQIPNGSYKIMFHYSGYKLQTSNKITVKGSNLSKIALRLSVPTYTLRGTAVDAGGNPLADLPVRLITSSNDGSYWPGTDADGEFKLTDIAPGSYTVVIGNASKPAATLAIVVNGDQSGIIVQAGN